MLTEGNETIESKIFIESIIWHPEFRYQISMLKRL
jgi:hypothetical protein